MSKLLTQVGPGTRAETRLRWVPGGELMRICRVTSVNFPRFDAPNNPTSISNNDWHPIICCLLVSELAAFSPFRTKEIRIMGEDLVLFRDRSGKLGLIDGRPAGQAQERRLRPPTREPGLRRRRRRRGLRCQYHGWKYEHYPLRDLTTGKYERGESYAEHPREQTPYTGWARHARWRAYAPLLASHSRRLRAGRPSAPKRSASWARTWSSSETAAASSASSTAGAPTDA